MRLAKALPAAALAFALCGGAIPAASAATEAPFTEPAFTAAQAAGRPILVHITASWCPTCARQRPILSELMTRPAFGDLLVYDVDFDSQKDLVRAFGARMQSTLIVFHGKVEEGRSTGETDPAAIAALLAKAHT